MAQQTLTGNAKSLGAVADGGTVTITPSEYPQVIGGVTISTAPITTTINATTGDFSISVTKGAKINIKCKDGLGKTFVNSHIHVTSDDSANLSSYLPVVTAPASITGDYVSSFNTRTGDVTLTFADITALGITPSIAEINYVDGVTSAIQTQLNNKTPRTASSGSSSGSVNNIGTSVVLNVDNNANNSFVNVVNDGSVEVKGTAGVYLGSVTGTSHFEPDGTLVFGDTATVWKDLTTPIISAVSSGPGVSISTAEQAALFVQTADLNDYVPISYQINHDWKSGSVVYPHIHFEQTTANMPNWLIRYRWQINGGAKVTSWTDYKCNTGAFTYVSGTLNQIAYGAGITPPVGYSISDILQIRIFRDTGNTSLVFTGTDPVAATQNVTAADIHYEIDTIGSRTEYTK